MERLPILDQGIFTPAIYSASSIGDIYNSREDVIQFESRMVSETASSLPFGLKHISAYDRFLNRWANRLVNHNELFGDTVRVGAWILVPMIRHFPENDTQTAPNKIMVEDVTAEMVLEFPDFYLSKVLAAGGFNVPNSQVKKLDWCSDLVISATFRPGFNNKILEKYVLLDVSNRAATNKEEQLSWLAAINAQLTKAGVRA